MNNKEIIKLYEPFVEFISDAIGSSFEVVLHDLSKSDNTIIAIRNGNITDRKIGDKLSDLTRRVLNENNLSDDEFRNYQKEAFFRKGIDSYNYVIRNLEGKPIGLLGINYNSKALNEAKDFINSIFANKPVFEVDKNINVNKDISNNSDSFITLAESIIDGVILESDVKPDRMNTEEKKNIVKKLSEKGVFQLKGVIESVAEKLCVSEVTVYRYLNNM
jgi:predicted transcriptional regulator YheO